MSAADGGCFKPQKIEQIDWSGHGQAAALKAEIERLNAEVLEQCRLNGMGAEREARLMAQLTESQAREKVLCDSLDSISEYWNGCANEVAMHDALCHILEAAQVARTLPPNHTALDALLRAEREKERERIAAFADREREKGWWSATGDEIRALGDE